MNNQQSRQPQQQQGQQGQRAQTNPLGAISKQIGEQFITQMLEMLGPQMMRYLSQAAGQVAGPSASMGALRPGPQMAQAPPMQPAGPPQPSNMPPGSIRPPVPVPTNNDMDPQLQLRMLAQALLRGGMQRG